MRLKHKVIVITGASKGLGKALATEFVREGSKVIISARDKKELNATARKIGATPFAADVTNEKDLIRLARFAKQRFSRIDIWINNAGVTLPHASLEDIDTKAAHHVLEVNFFGTFNGSRAAAPVMKKQKGGVIVNIVSMSALVGRPQSLVYSASKWAARGFTEGLRLALQKEHISVITVHPGGIKTEIFGTFVPKGYEHWMEPAFVAKKIMQNLKRNKPKEEVVINK